MFYYVTGEDPMLAAISVVSWCWLVLLLGGTFHFVTDHVIAAAIAGFVLPLLCQCCFEALSDSSLPRPQVNVFAVCLVAICGTPRSCRAP